MPFAGLRALGCDWDRRWSKVRCGLSKSSGVLGTWLLDHLTLDTWSWQMMKHRGKNREKTWRRMDNRASWPGNTMRRWKKIIGNERTAHKNRELICWFSLSFVAFSSISITCQVITCQVVQCTVRLLINFPKSSHGSPRPQRTPTVRGLITRNELSYLFSLVFAWLFMICQMRVASCWFSLVFPYFSWIPIKWSSIRWSSFTRLKWSSVPRGSL